jgi:hypothetical protein
MTNLTPPHKKIEPAVLEKISNLSQGSYMLTTLHGTRHLLNLDAGIVIRKPAEGREWSDGTLTHDGSPFRIGNYSGSIESIWWDEEAQQARKTPDIRLGARIHFQNINEWRLTSALQKIEKLSDAREN